MALAYIPTSGASDQVIYQTPTAAELNEVAEVPEEKNSSRSIGKVIPAEDALTKNDVRIDEYHKLRLPHQGFKEKAIETKSEATYEKTTVTLDNGEEIEALAHVGVEERDVRKNPYATTKDDHVTKKGTFEVTRGVNQFGPWENVKFIPTDEGDISTSQISSSQTEEVDLIQPVAALATDEAQQNEIDRHWRQGREDYTAITQENHLSRPGMKVKTSETYLAQLEAEAAEEEPEPDPQPADEGDELPPVGDEESAG